MKILVEPGFGFVSKNHAFYMFQNLFCLKNSPIMGMKTVIISYGLTSLYWKKALSYLTICTPKRKKTDNSLSNCEQKREQNDELSRQTEQRRTNARN